MNQAEYDSVVLNMRMTVRSRHNPAAALLCGQRCSSTVLWSSA
jgi:hypothetical protein